MGLTKQAVIPVHMFPNESINSKKRGKELCKFQFRYTLI